MPGKLAGDLLGKDSSDARLKMEAAERERAVPVGSCHLRFWKKSVKKGAAEKKRKKGPHTDFFKKIKAREVGPVRKQGRGGVGTVSGTDS